MPLRFMSRMRSCTSYAPGRISAKLVGSIPQSSFGQVTTALRPIDPAVAPWKSHCSTPWSFVTTLGASSLYFSGTCRSNMSRGSITWSSMLTRIMSSIRMALLRVCRQSGTRARSAHPVGKTPAMDLAAVQDLMETTYGERDRARGLAGRRWPGSPRRSVSSRVRSARAPVTSSSTSSATCWRGWGRWRTSSGCRSTRRSPATRAAAPTAAPCRRAGCSATRRPRRRSAGS